VGPGHPGRRQRPTHEGASCQSQLKPSHARSSHAPGLEELTAILRVHRRVPAARPWHVALVSAVTVQPGTRLKSLSPKSAAGGWQAVIAHSAGAGVWRPWRWRRDPAQCHTAVRPMLYQSVNQLLASCIIHLDVCVIMCCFMWNWARCCFGHGGAFKWVHTGHNHIARSRSSAGSMLSCWASAEVRNLPARPA
jgi:hypothetical protein